MRIRLLLTPPLSGVANMAVDEALLARARQTGEVAVRVYTWARPTLSFGRHQTARGVYDPHRAAHRGIDVVRRPTGGRAVLHAREVTYSVTAPIAALAPADAPLRAAYDRINGMLGSALRALGVPVMEATATARAARPDGTPCFHAPTAGELVAGDGPDARKLVGSAQWRDEGALLQHGSILVEDDQTRLAECAAVPLPEVPPPATLRAALGRAPSCAEVARALFAAAPVLDPYGAAEVAPLSAATPCVEDTGDRGSDIDALREAVGDADLAADAAQRAARYADAAWTWRR